MAESESKNLGQIATLWISAYQPDNVKLVWYDTVERIHKVYETSTGTWIALNPQVVTNDTLDAVRTLAQNYGLSVGKFYYLTDVGTLAVVISATRIWYVDTNGNYIVNDLVSTYQAYVNSDNLLIDGTTGAWDITTGKLKFEFSTITSGGDVDGTNDYFVMRRYSNSVWSWIKFRLKNIISSVSGNSIIWNNGLFFSLKAGIESLLNRVGGIVGYDQYQTDMNNMNDRINNASTDNDNILSSAKTYTDEQTEASKIYNKKHSGSWGVLTNPPTLPSATATLNEILTVLISWTKNLQNAAKIFLGSEFAASGRSGEVNYSDSVKSAIEKLVYKAKNFKDKLFVNVSSETSFVLSDRNVYLIGSNPAEFRVLNKTKYLDVTVEDEQVSNGILGIIPRNEIGILLTGYTKYKIYVNANAVIRLMLQMGYEPGSDNDVQILEFSMSRLTDDYQTHVFTESEVSSIQYILRGTPNAKGVYFKIINGQVDFVDSHVATGENIYFGTSGNGHPDVVYRYSDSNATGTYTRQSVRNWDDIFDGEKGLWAAGFISSGFITQEMLAADSVAGDQIEDDSVDTNHILDNAISWPKIANGAVTAEKLADDALICDIRNYMSDGAILPLGKLYYYDIFPLEHRISREGADGEQRTIIFGYYRGFDGADYYETPTRLIVFQEQSVDSGEFVFLSWYDWDSAPSEFKNMFEVPDYSVTTNKLDNGAVTNSKIADNTIAPDKLDFCVSNSFNLTPNESINVVNMYYNYFVQGWKMTFVDAEGSNATRLGFTTANVLLLLNTEKQTEFKTTRLTITGGPVYATSFQSTSDKRLKDIIQNVILKAEDIAAMSAILFRFKEDKNKEIHIGSLAQDWEKILPEAVKKDNNGFLALNYAGASMISVISLAKELVEVKKELSETKKELNDLKSRIEKLEKLSAK